MFIKLTRTDGRPIWINPEFIVTVEGRKDGGSIVVPAGDGLDYDVKESPDSVMRLCGGETAAQPAAAEPAEALAESKDVKAVEAECPPAAAEPTDALPMRDAPQRPVAEAEATVQALREKVNRLRKAAEVEKVEQENVEQKPKPAAKPRKRTSRGKKPVIDLTDEQMERLKKMAPGSRQKLLNTLSHLKVANAEATAVALIAHKVIEILPDNHVNWLAP